MAEETKPEKVAQSSSWTAFVKSIASFNGDLASLTAPPFILSSTSLVEYSAFWYASHSLFVAPAKEQTPEARFLAVLRWFIGTLRGQYCSRNEKTGSEKKPLNPFLGELFVGLFDQDESKTYVVSEQVSHHPPVNGYSLFNDDDEVTLEGYNGFKTRFSMGTIAVKQQGHATYRLKAFDETYFITLPALHIEGIIYAQPYVELEGKSVIESSTGYKAVIDYSGKGYFSGKKNSFKAYVYKDGNTAKGSSLYKVSGQWSGISNIKNEKSGKEELFLDSTKIAPCELSVKPVEQQDPMESRAAWKKFADAIRVGNYDLASYEKSKIENEQRDMRKKELADGAKWQTRWFNCVAASDSSALYQALSQAAGVKLEDHWTFQREKYNADHIKPE